MVAVLKSDIACQLIIFVTYVTSFLSVWFIVGFTCERFVAICFPLKGKEMCNMFREKMVVFALTLTSCLIYMFTFWTTGIEEWGELRMCSHKVEYFLFLKVVTWMDTFITMIIPFIVITVVNCLILRTVRRCPVRAEQRRQSRNRKAARACEGMDNKTENNNHTKRARRKRTPLIRVTKTLIFVSTTFLLLNLPSHIIRIYNLITVSTSQMGVSIWFYILQELSLLLYYSTFSCNFVLYTLFGRNFKRSLLHILKCHKSLKRQREQAARKQCHSRMKTSSL
ncbi:thyrotropin-releasing hormone receptor-like [Ruditapes philippinarum]|uniref:thyrotropin-releasing hormone receptor-like n=1 Tax=Ruditapes philippinarum TaxID=129788 RepID=UPI00295C06B1|nr:thyrotropin-releasing hormone receptor-like [Ruditapes philippinarum]